MNLKTYYTAVGRLEIKKDEQGRCYPVVICCNEEYYLDLQEMIIWNSLNWHIAQIDEIGVLYMAAAKHFGTVSDRSWHDCVTRLTVRGLLADGIGDTEYDALYDLLSALYIIPTNSTFCQRVATTFKLILTGCMPPSAAKNIFHRDKRTEDEKTVMKLARQALLSTAEVIKCAEKGIRCLPDENSTLEALYSEPYTTRENLRFLVRCSSHNRSVTLAVTSLYLRKQIMFDQM